MRNERKRWKLRCPVCDSVLFSECNTMEARVVCKKCRSRYRVVARDGVLTLIDRDNGDAERMLERVGAYMKELDILNDD